MPFAKIMQNKAHLFTSTRLQSMPSLFGRAYAFRCGIYSYKIHSRSGKKASEDHDAAGQAGAAPAHPMDRPGDLCPADHLPSATHRDIRRHRHSHHQPRTGSASPSIPPATRSSRPPASSPATTIDFIGKIGHAVRDHLLPERRRKTCPRVVKRAISKHRAKGDIDNSYKITIDVTINGQLTTGP